MGTFVSDQQQRNSPPWSSSSEGLVCSKGNVSDRALQKKKKRKQPDHQVNICQFVWDMFDMLSCHLSSNRQLIGPLSARCLRSSLHSVTQSLDLIVFLMVKANFARHWRNDASHTVSKIRGLREKLGGNFLCFCSYLNNLTWEMSPLIRGPCQTINIGDTSCLFVRFALTLHTHNPAHSLNLRHISSAAGDKNELLWLGALQLYERAQGCGHICWVLFPIWLS